MKSLTSRTQIIDIIIQMRRSTRFAHTISSWQLTVWLVLAFICLLSHLRCLGPVLAGTVIQNSQYAFTDSQVAEDGTLQLGTTTKGLQTCFADYWCILKYHWKIQNGRHQLIIVRNDAFTDRLASEHDPLAYVVFFSWATYELKHTYL